MSWASMGWVLARWMLETPSSQFTEAIKNVPDVVWGRKFEVIFLPASLRNRAVVPTWIQRGLRTLVDVCRDAGVPIYSYDDDSEESSLRTSDAFLRFLDHPSIPDENPLKVEWERRMREVLPVTDDGTSWDFGKGLDAGSESGEMGELGDDYLP
ncbi:hypothetical protein JCM10296v2_003233 [Rhodotorula toruloides]